VIFREIVSGYKNKRITYWICHKILDRQFDKKVKPDSPSGEKVKVALLLITQYEGEHHPVPIPYPIDAIKLKMEEL
jgi:antitoxin component HigA of HigAB toxin-antitoxin module